jgi:hypothetical protein
MQRGAVRATVGGVAVDIPLGTFASPGYLRYNPIGGVGSTPVIDSSASGIHVTGWNTATQVSAVTTLADIAGHAAFALGVGTYYFRLKGAYQSNAITTGLKVSASFSGTATAYDCALAVVTSATGAVIEFFAQTTLNTAFGSGNGPGAVNQPFDMWGRIVVTVAGTFAFRIASEVAVAAGITLAVGAQSTVWQA